MKTIALVSLLWLMYFMNILAQDLLRMGKYEITKNSVIEGQFKSVADSPTRLRSNYPKISEEGFNRTITFKFSINGEDNERKSGLDHKIFLNPINGKQITPIFKFGEVDPVGSSLPQGKENGLGPNEKIEVTFRLDLRNILSSFDKDGYFLTFDGKKILKTDFKGVFIAGGSEPLNWNFGKELVNERFKLIDDDMDGIFEVKINFFNRVNRQIENGFSIWELNKDISSYPSYKSENTLVEALYNLSLEEMLANVRNDSAFMAGSKWTGVWTRDISYSIILSLAAINPDACKISLMAKVKNGIIIQDTGTGGSWPVSTDRMVWAIAAWEVYKVTADHVWLENIYSIIKKSVENDLENIFDQKTNLVRGESTFLDWREQTYPRWMDPKDIYSSINLGTNAIHYQTFLILSNIANILGDNGNDFLEIANRIKVGMNKCLWNEKEKHFNQYLYGRATMSSSPRYEALGTALTILFDIADKEKIISSISNQPLNEYGVPTIYPQIPNIPPYHNNSVWPFVSAYWAWASSKTNNCKSVEIALASIYRSAALFLTNKENYVFDTGNFLGTEINSDRQLWSVAGNLATVLRIFFGMNFEKSGIKFSPFIPKFFNGKHCLSNFKYRAANLKITVEGFGNQISMIKLDGEKILGNLIDGNLTGNHEIQIILSNKISEGSVNYVENLVSPETPIITKKDKKLEWDKSEGIEYYIFQNGKVIQKQRENFFYLPEQSSSMDELQVIAVDKNGHYSFLSEPVFVNDSIQHIYNVTENRNEYLELSKSQNNYVQFEFNINKSGKFLIDVNYANGNGPINTDNKCALRTLYVNGVKIGTIIMPQRGLNLWNDWGFSNSVIVDLHKGKNIFKLAFNNYNANMNFETNSALIKYFRIIPVEKENE